MFEEFEIVELTHDIKEHNLKEGVRGTVVEVYENGKAYEVEFVTPEGKTVALLTLIPNDIRSAKDKNNRSFYELDVPVYLSTAGTVSSKHTIGSKELRFNIDTPKSKVDTEEFRYPTI